MPKIQWGTMKVDTEKTVMPRSNTLRALRAILSPRRIPKKAESTVPVVKRRTVMGSRSMIIVNRSLDPALLFRNMALPRFSVRASLV